jgi:transposase-like protein
MRKRYTAADRSRFYQEVRETGESVRAVAERLGIGASTAYQWQQRERARQKGEGRQAEERQAHRARPKFARVVPASTRALMVHVGAAAIRAEAGFDPELLRALVAALAGQER